MSNPALAIQHDPRQLAALAQGSHPDPFSILGPHQVAGQTLVTAIAPKAQQMALLGVDGRHLAWMTQVHPGGLFQATLPARRRRYLLRSGAADGQGQPFEDAYRFGSTLGEVDRHLIAEGNHQRLYEVLGSHCMRLNGVAGTRFAVWAPNASAVSVVGDFNGWDRRCHVMAGHHGIGVWELFIPGIKPGALYKYCLLDADGAELPLKSDPLANFHEAAPGNASRVYRSRYRWRDQAWMASRAERSADDQPMSIYEIHLGSWRRHRDGSPLSYRELSDQLPAYLKQMGFTHVEFMPVTEFPFEGSWGYQPIGLFSPACRWGEPDDLRRLIDRLHGAGISVIMDWVPAHFPRDEHGLRRFDGTALYEHPDPRRGEHADWGTMVFNYGRREVSNYLIASALYWVEVFHIDALRVDAVASMLYLDYSRQEGRWLPNQYGGKENLEAVEVLRKMNVEVARRGAQTHAEESTAWPGVSRPVEQQGLGFSAKWNMGWMNDTLAYISEDPLHRSHHHDRVTFGLVYAFDEKFILPLSHDEVVHGKGSLLSKMPGDQWQRLAGLRAYLMFMFAHPGKKLLFMGSELAQPTEWNHDSQIDWSLLDDPHHQGISRLVQSINHRYQSTPALYQQDFDQQGFSWINLNDRDHSVLSWVRVGLGGELLVCIINFTPVVRTGYRIGVPVAGAYRQLLNSDAEQFGGSGVQLGSLDTTAVASDGRDQSLQLTLPPMAGIWLAPVDQ